MLFACISPPVKLTFGTEEADCVVGAVAFRTLFLIEAPEAHQGICMDRLSSFTGWHPVSGSRFDCSGSLTHSGTVVEANGLQLLIVSTASGVVNIEPCGPVVGVWTEYRNVLGMRFKPPEKSLILL